MNNDIKADKFIEIALTRMFQVVGIKYKKSSCKKPNWYLKHTWTQEQSDIYGKWFIDEYCKTFKSSLKTAKTEWMWFFMNYGWKINND